MANPTRFNRIGAAGQKKSTANRGDWFTQTFTFTPAVVASGTAQVTAVTLPTNCVSVSVTVNVLTAEATGTTKTLSVGFDGGSATALASVADVSAVALVAGTDNVIASGETLNYTLGSADFVELDCEVVIQVLASDG